MSDTSETQYTKLIGQVAQRYRTSGLPFSGQIELTKRCHLDCVHCYVDHEALGDELTLAELQDLLTQFHAMNLMQLTLTGGEPFLRKDVLFQLLEQAQRLAFFTAVLTTATLVSEDDARRMHDLALAEIGVSLYSDQAAIHDAITKRPGSHAQTMRGIRTLRKHGLRVVVKTPILTLNRSTLLSTIRLAKELGCRFQQDMQILPAENGSRHPQALALSAQEMRDLFRDETWFREVYEGGNLEQYCGEIRNEAPEGEVCTIARNRIMVDAFGVVWFCSSWKGRETIRQKSLKEIWFGEEAEDLRSLRWEGLTSCPTCSHKTYCSPCPALSRDETGNLLACAPTVRNRVEALLAARSFAKVEENA